MYEPVTRNRYLGDYFASPRGWALHSQIEFLLQRLVELRRLTNDTAATLLDRTVFEDAEVIVPALNRIGILPEREYRTYLSLHELLTENIPRPDAYVYLHAPDQLLRRRIARRSALERQFLDRLLHLLQLRYATWVDRLPKARVLKIDASLDDFLNDDDASNRICCSVWDLVSNLPT